MNNYIKPQFFSTKRKVLGYIIIFFFLFIFPIAISILEFFFLEQVLITIPASTFFVIFDLYALYAHNKNMKGRSEINKILPEYLINYLPETKHLILTIGKEKYLKIHTSDIVNIKKITTQSYGALKIMGVKLYNEKIDCIEIITKDNISLFVGPIDSNEKEIEILKKLCDL